MKNMFCVSQGNFSLARNNPLPTRFKGGRVLLKQLAPQSLCLCELKRSAEKCLSFWNISSLFNLKTCRQAPHCQEFCHKNITSLDRQNCTVLRADLFLVFIHSEVVKNDYFGCFSIPSEDLSEAQYCKDHTVKVLCYVSCFFQPRFQFHFSLFLFLFLLGFPCSSPLLLGFDELASITELSNCCKSQDKKLRIQYHS